MQSEIVYNVSSWGVWIFLVIPVILLYLYLANYRKKKIANFGRGTVYGTERSILLFWVKIVLISISLVMLIVALMQPALKKLNGSNEVNWKEGEMSTQPSIGTIPYQEIVFLVDVSESMGVKDCKDRDDRLTRTKEIIDGLLDQLGGVYVSMYVFSGDTVNLIPSTTDLISQRLQTQELYLNMTEKSGTDFSQLIEEMRKKYLNRNGNDKVCFVLLSDGEDTDFVNLTVDVKQQAQIAVAELVRAFPEIGINWYSVAVGQETGGVIPGLLFNNKSVTSKMDTYMLRKIAEYGKGKFYKDDDLSLSELVEELISTIFNPNYKSTFNLTEDGKETATSLFYIPAAFSFVLLSISLIMKERRRS